MDHMPPKLDARLRAIEFLIVNLYGIENRRRAWDADRIVKEHGELLSRMRGQSRSEPTRGPLSDVYLEVERLLADIRAVS